MDVIEVSSFKLTLHNLNRLSVIDLSVPIGNALVGRALFQLKVIKT